MNRNQTNTMFTQFSVYFGHILSDYFERVGHLMLKSDTRFYSYCNHLGPHHNIFIFFSLVLRRINTVKVIWRLSSSIGGGRPQ